MLFANIERPKDLQKIVLKTVKKYTVNIQDIVHCESDDRNTIINKNKNKIPLAVRKKEEFMTLIDSL